LSSDTAPKPATDDDLATSPWNSLAIGIALTVGIIIGVLLGGLQRNLTPSTESHLPANTSFSQTSQSVEVIASCISEAQSSDRRCEFRINEQALQPWQNDGLGAADPASKTQTLRFRMLPNTVAPFGTATMPTNSPKGTR
jgi:hypothetical protein